MEYEKIVPEFKDLSEEQELELYQLMYDEGLNNMQEAYELWKKRLLKHKKRFNNHSA